MNDLTKKIFISGSLIFSICALGTGLLLVKHQSRLAAQFDALNKTSYHLKPAAHVPIAPTELRNTWLDVQKKVKDTVVQVFAHVSEFNLLEPYKTPEQREGAGSGFFVNDQGDIISNYHVVAQASSVEIQIPSFGLERFDVEIIGVAPERDIALLRVTAEAREKIKAKITKIPFLNLGDSDNILRSQEVLAIGYPLGQSRLKSTLGIVSGRERLGNAGFIQITAPLNPGNSGGPALNTAGEVVGINSAGVPGAQNVGYIIPINEVKSALKDLPSVKLLRKPTLGCLFTAATPEMVQYLKNPGDGGWYIAKVFKGTLFESVGIKEDDMLYEVNGHRIDMYGDLDVPWSEDKASLFEFLNRLNVGDPLTFTIYRKGERKEFHLKFEPKFLPPIRMIYPEFEAEAIDYEVIGGMVIMPLTINHVLMLKNAAPDLVRFGKIEQQHEPALIVTNILPNSQAFKARILSPGEIIEQVNGVKVKTLTDFRNAVKESTKSRYITLRTDDNFYAVLSVDKIVREEEMLASRYFFKKSPLIALLDNRPALSNVTPKKTGK
ncbi:PDZ domain-containing protein [Candidatus Dependentiae bacterium]|nr:PDZ domain-containing protein [Candidatus Dependentiae bacterium]